MGYLERRDVLGAVDFLRQKGIERIGVLGFSMGAVVAMITLPMCDEIQAMISDGGFGTLFAPMLGWARVRKVPTPIARPLFWLMLLFTSFRLRNHLFDYQPIHWVGGIAPRPILFIHGEKDPYVTMKDFRILEESAGEPNEVWIDPNAGHREIDRLHPEEYRKRIVDFFIRHL